MRRTDLDTVLPVFAATNISGLADPELDTISTGTLESEMRVVLLHISLMTATQSKSTAAVSYLRPAVILSMLFRNREYIAIASDGGACLYAFPPLGHMETNMSMSLLLKALIDTGSFKPMFFLIWYTTSRLPMPLSVMPHVLERNLVRYRDDGLRQQGDDPFHWRPARWTYTS
jgi:hypothetical protein